MRVVAGECKGIPLKSAQGDNTRPTTDKVKESLFNIIGPYFDGGLVVDLFAGSGGLGLEALSRGMDHGIFIEKDNKAFQALQYNIAKCRYEEQTECYRNDAMRAVKALIKRDEVIDLIFLDPPYAKIMYYDVIHQLVEANKIAKDGMIICEHSKQFTLAEAYGDFVCQRTEVYGDIAISIFQTKGE